jgi:hypothetical protein
MKFLAWQIAVGDAMLQTNPEYYSSLYCWVSSIQSKSCHIISNPTHSNNTEVKHKTQIWCCQVRQLRQETLTQRARRVHTHVSSGAVAVPMDDCITDMWVSGAKQRTRVEQGSYCMHRQPTADGHNTGWMDLRFPLQQHNIWMYMPLPRVTLSRVTITEL